MIFGKKKRRITRLLIVEDEPLVAFDTEHALREDGFEVVETTDSALAAIRLLSEGVEIDLVLVDLGLVDGSGVDVAHAARARGIAVMFVTGQSPDAVATAIAMGCLSKPYPPRDLLQAIAVLEAVIEGRKPRRVPASLRLFDPAG
ncbi:MAG: response regulator [Alphaproteobacteria bacterium HGW-Alphaproteobacteria-16]|nr:MAG: response regulator [Alphaproteobacteria bacterium HGW-Alphaproteobacteria-16]